jgi:hypothetical protein
MDNVADNTPPGWAEILDESLAEIDAGLLVSSDDVHGAFRDAKSRRKPEAQAPGGRVPSAH